MNGFGQLNLLSALFWMKQPAPISMPGDNHIFMHGETFEQFSIAEDMIGGQRYSCKMAMSVTLQNHEGDPISITLPEQVVLTVVEADAVIKGQTASLLTSRCCR